jgi:elongation factor Ts
MFVKREDVPADLIEREKNVYLGQIKESGKPEAAWDKIMAGKLEKFFQEQCLLEQAFIKDPSVTIQDLIAQKIAKLGENISISRFTRYQLGQD